ncbi:hypothetical protein GJAV_G00172340 [Gymnothorax javanicus]|nr:hypothetical protein GJAV_G00172340 [Gymnothorax javanicus]
MYRTVVFCLGVWAVVSVLDAKPRIRKQPMEKGASDLAAIATDAPPAGGSLPPAPPHPHSPGHRKRGQPIRPVLKEGAKAGEMNAKKDDVGLQLATAPPVQKNLAEIKNRKQGMGSVSGKKVSKQVPGPRRPQEAEGKLGTKRSQQRAKPSPGVNAGTMATAIKNSQKEKKLQQVKDENAEAGEEDEKEGRGTPSPGFLEPSVLNRANFMESLPAGCLLSESLIACGSVGMVHLPIIADLGVTTLYLADNRIRELPFRGLSGLPNLEWLDLSKNKLEDSSLSTAIFRNLTKLRRLNLDGNGLTKIPPLPPSLEELKINDNKIKSLSPQSFRGLSKLLTLELEANGLHDGNVSPLAFRPLKAVIYLRLDRNKFRGIPSGLPPSLQELHLSENRIEEVHEGVLNKSLQLKTLDLSRNRIREDRIAPRAWFHLPKLESLDLSHNKLVHVPSFLPAALRLLTLHHNQIERIPGYVFGHLHPGLQSLHLSHNRLVDDGIHGVSFLGLYGSLTELLLDNNHLQSIPQGLLLLRNLQHLRLNHNFISYVPLDSICDTRVSEDSTLVSVHLENNLIDRRLIPPTAFSCIRTYHSVLLRPQRHEEEEEEE